MSSPEHIGHCAAHELDDLSLEQLGTEVTRKCTRQIILHAYGGDIESQISCHAELRLTEDGITEYTSGYCNQFSRKDFARAAAGDF